MPARKCFGTGVRFPAPPLKGVAAFAATPCYFCTSDFFLLDLLDSPCNVLNIPLAARKPLHPPGRDKETGAEARQVFRDERRDDRRREQRWAGGHRGVGERQRSYVAPAERGRRMVVTS